ncbi:MAG TPA: hypothetical protein VJS44_09265 [Pyrinomonadaceae bacterium]|nr:hypothetical protein [Pyrinomonadaceae bacterium]
MRALSAALLTLAILSSALPLAVLSSSHSCSMPCCAGVEGGCATGACQGAIFKSPKKEEAVEKLCGSEEAFKSEAASKKREKKTPIDASHEADHCASEKENGVTGGAKAKASGSSNEAYGERQGRTVSARAFTAGCAKDCCAAASPSTQSRRGRDSALANLPGKQPPADFVSLSLYLLKLQPERSAHLKRLKARAPPRTLSSTQA